MPGAEDLGATISVGIAMFGRERDASAEAVLIAADQAMYRAKRAGKDRVSGGTEDGDDLAGRPPVEVQPWPPSRP